MTLDAKGNKAAEEGSGQSKVLEEAKGAGPAWTEQPGTKGEIKQRDEGWDLTSAEGTKAGDGELRLP